MKNADTPSIPVKNADMTTDFYGLTKREMLAMNAMQGLLSGPTCADLYDTPDEWRKNIVETSVEFADALLAELDS